MSASICVRHSVMGGLRHGRPGQPDAAFGVPGVVGASLVQRGGRHLVRGVLPGRTVGSRCRAVGHRLSDLCEQLREVSDGAGESGISQQRIGGVVANQGVGVAHGLAECVDQIRGGGEGGQGDRGVLPMTPVRPCGQDRGDGVGPAGSAVSVYRAWARRTRSVPDAVAIAVASGACSWTGASPAEVSAVTDSAANGSPALMPAVSMRVTDWALDRAAPNRAVKSGPSCMTRYGSPNMRRRHLSHSGVVAAGVLESGSAISSSLP